MKILVISQLYPVGNSRSMAYVHTRNQHYVEQGHEVVVLCFGVKSIHVENNIQVVSENYFNSNFKLNDFNIVVSHAPNLRNHIRFLLWNRLKIKNLVFFIHGHEVLRKKNYYTKPYEKLSSFLQKITSILDDAYDYFKLKMLRFVLRTYFKSGTFFVFVSEEMKKNFLVNLRLNASDIRYNVIPNSVNSIFENRKFSKNKNKVADFITIRSFDVSTYCADLLVRAAEQNPKFTFHLYGEGSYFDYYAKPQNLTVFKKKFKHEELPDLLDQYRAALMLTRHDSQGVMASEMATYGMPVVTSDIPICREVFKDFSNVRYISNEDFKFSADELLAVENSIQEIPDKYYMKNTVQKELELFDKLVLETSKGF